MNATGSDPRRELLLELLQAALAAVDGRHRTADTLKSLSLESAAPRGYHVAAVGKAACAMALGAHDALGAAILRTLIIAKDGHLEAAVTDLPEGRGHRSSHPLPDERSLAAGQRLFEFVGGPAGGCHAAVPDFGGRLQLGGGADSRGDVGGSASPQCHGPGQRLPTLPN
ncbi:MAG: DUF4147 domain-containing protein [Steroidobacteraceae bacterium]